MKRKHHLTKKGFPGIDFDNSEGQEMYDRHVATCKHLIKSKESKENISVPLDPTKQALIDRVYQEFKEIRLTSGIGILEGEGMDDYLSPDALRFLRNKDRELYATWEDIPSEALDACYCALSFTDAIGMRFMFPAFLVHDLKEGLPVGPAVFYMMCDVSDPKLHDYTLNKFTLFSPAQIDVLRDYYTYYRQKNGANDPYIQNSVPFYDLMK